MKRICVKITGIVQGVGFRPFVYNLAQKFRLTGWVQNNAEGVLLEIQGESEMLDVFITEIVRDAPPLAVITNLTAAESIISAETNFVIKESLQSVQGSALISPDIALCAECAAEIKNRKDRRFRYAFTNCTNCGPRYSIIEDIPYDRVRTSMKDFPMCTACRQEYDSPHDRRFHAQPNACPECGPVYALYNKDGEQEIGDPLLRTRQLIQEGAIVAIKGIGGYHLSCNARDSEAVRRLRSLKKREYKPFAVMCGSLKAAREQVLISDIEEKLLTGSVSPIVLLQKGPTYSLAEATAPGNPWLGVMLPYAPNHHLLLEAEDIWVMTSGNISEEPIVYQDEDARARLVGIADYFLIHNRPIRHRVEDSLVRAVAGEPLVLRRGRGFVPFPVFLTQRGPQVLACGPELKNTFCLTKEDKAFLSNHNGDLEGMANFTAYAAEIEQLKKLFEVTPELIAYDFHPRYLSTQYALSQDLPRVGVQHHHAHIASVMAEHGVEKKVLGIAFDGTGYGSDGHLWGGEFMVADLLSFKRLAHCRYLKLPGGSKAIQEPWRIAASLLEELYGDDFINLPIPLTRLVPQEWPLVLKAAAQGINTPLTSSAGRLFDVAAALLGICTHSRYEGQAAMELEFAAQDAIGRVLPYDITGDSILELDFRPCFLAMTEALLKGEKREVLAASFHQTMAAATAEMARRLATLAGIKTVALSGGVFQNVALLLNVKQQLEDQFTVLIHRRIPPNDGGVALGQAVIARERSKRDVFGSTSESH